MAAPDSTNGSQLKSIDLLDGLPRMDPSKLGKKAGPPIILRPVPSPTNMASIQFALGLVMMLISFIMLSRKNFWALPGLLAGFVFFFGGLHKLRAEDKRVRTIHPRQVGFVFQIGEKSFTIPDRALSEPVLTEDPIRAKSIKLGARHTLVAKINGRAYQIQSYESHEGIEPRETDPFALWARGLVQRLGQ